jgi:hypothetical protein
MDHIQQAGISNISVVNKQSWLAFILKTESIR